MDGWCWVVLACPSHLLLHGHYCCNSCCIMAGDAAAATALTAIVLWERWRPRLGTIDTGPQA